MAQGGSNKKIANKLVVASCAGVLAVYTAGYDRTQAAADRLAAQVAERRAAVPAPQRVTFDVPELRSRERIPDRRPPAAPVPDRARRTADTPDKKAERAEAVTVVVPASIAEPASIESPEPVLAIAQVLAPPVNLVPPQVPAPSIAPLPALPAAPAPAPAKAAWKDGTYTGWGYSRHGNIEATVVIEAGRILSANISQCRTRYSCSVIDKLIPQVALRQSPEVDYVSGATQSADAFYGAVVEALSKAK
jgi:uncharacterized protein with FMN-binding domain